MPNEYKMRKDTDHISELNYNKLGTDFKVEAVTANLLKYYKEHASVFIKKIGVNDRPYLKDIKKIYTSHYGLDQQTIVLETYRESIYDYLPEGLFHPPSLGQQSYNVDSVVKEIKKQKAVEESARNFFQPFEQEFFYTEVAALLKEMELDIADQSHVIIEVIADLWPLLKEVDGHTARTFFHILPFLHEVRGNRKWIEKFLSAFLNVKVCIDFVANKINEQKDPDGMINLGTTTLGINFIPNGAHWDGERNWRVNIGPIPYPKIHKYVPGHPFRKLLQGIYDYLMPLSVRIEENFVTEKKKNSFVLGKTSNTNRLSYSTFI